MKKIFLAGLLLTLIIMPITVFADEERYISAAFFEEEEKEPVIYVTTARLNLRPEPSVSNTRITVADAGTHVEVLDFLCGEWYKVKLNGTIGFMSAEYLRELYEPQIAGSVELLEWSEARKLLTYGTVFTLIDVRTGLSWQAASFSNGNHADIEPITAEDTATKLKAFGSWTWTPRPVLVVINGRTLAASVNGMPHAGSTRKNNMNGHVCLHFLGSTTHTSSPSHVRDHQNAVTEAFNTGLYA